MNAKTNDPNPKRQPVRSSISVSDRVVCEDEACIGKTVTEPAEASPDVPSSDPAESTPEGSTITVGGKPACTDDACIGKG